MTNQETTFRYRNLVFKVPLLDGDGKELGDLWQNNPSTTMDIPSYNHPILQNIGTTWDQSKLAQLRTPIHVGQVTNRSNFSLRRDIRVLDMPIKFPGTNYRLPLEILPYTDTINLIRSFEASINPHVERYYAYLTIDQGYVCKGEMQRNKGYHVDGFQGARVWPKVAIGHSYVVSNSTPTVFAMQSFNAEHLNEAKHNFFLAFDRLVDKRLTWKPQVYQIMLMDAYTVHKAAIMEVSDYRTFFRLSFSVRVFDRMGNTHNPLFDYDWEMVARDVGHELEVNQ